MPFTYLWVPRRKELCALKCLTIFGLFLAHPWIFFYFMELIIISYILSEKTYTWNSWEKTTSNMDGCLTTNIEFHEFNQLSTAMTFIYNIALETLIPWPRFSHPRSLLKSPWDLQFPDRTFKTPTPRPTLNWVSLLLNWGTQLLQVPSHKLISSPTSK